MILGWNRKSDTKNLSVSGLCTSIGTGQCALVLPGNDFLRGGPDLAVGHNDRDWTREKRVCKLIPSSNSKDYTLTR